MENTLETKNKKEIAPYEVKQALIGLDLGETDVSTLKYVTFLSQQVPIKAAYFLHVLPKFDLLTNLYEKDTEALIGQDAIDEKLLKQMQKKVNSVLTNTDQLDVEYDISAGDPLEKMVQLAKKIQADLLVIGQGKGKSRHGIFAKNLARSTTADALVIPKDAKTEISTILVPVDFSESAAKALEAAIAIHKHLKQPARIICMHVYNVPNTNYFRNEEPWEKVKSTMESNLRDGFDAFLETVAGNYKNRIEIALVERQTTGTSNFIVDFALSNQIDFMVMGARGHSKVHLLLMGSVTEGVLDINQKVPTLIIR